MGIVEAWRKFFGKARRRSNAEHKAARRRAINAMALREVNLHQANILDIAFQVLAEQPRIHSIECIGSRHLSHLL